MVDGGAKERELVREVDGTEGWVAMRAPSSGSATQRDLPDVLAGRGGRSLAIELKASGGRPVYIEQHEVEALERFAQAFGSEAWVALRWSSRSLQDATFYLTRPQEMYRTDAGSYRAKYEDMPQWRTLASVLQG